MKKSPKSLILGSPTSKIVFEKLSIKKLGHTKNFGRRPLVGILSPIFEKNILVLPFEMNQILYFLGKLLQKWEQNSEKRHFEKKAQNPDD